MAVSNFQREYGGVIWTNHAVERLTKRNIYQSDALKVMQKPDKTYPGKKEDTVKFIRTLNNRRIHLVAALNDGKQWVVLTAFVRGEEDEWGFPERYVYQFVGWLMRKVTSMLRSRKA